METIQLSAVNVEECATRAAEVLRQGGIVLYPTDTLYGLGADALSDEAVAKIYAVKGRDEEKPIHAIVSDIEMAKRYGEVDEKVSHAIGALPKGQVTFVVRKREGVKGGIANIGTFGFRIPDNDFCAALLRTFDGPITATSANIAGLQTEHSLEKILEQLGANTEKIDIVVDAGALPERKASTIVDMTGAEPKVLREGAIAKADILQALDL